MPLVNNLNSFKGEVHYLFNSFMLYFIFSSSFFTDFVSLSLLKVTKMNHHISIVIECLIQIESNMLMNNGKAHCTCTYMNCNLIQI